nr:phosphoribosylformylglycinamidine synthase subunit PurL [Candidatus Sigynarchaeota archaeon]
MTAKIHIFSKENGMTGKEAALAASLSRSSNAKFDKVKIVMGYLIDANVEETIIERSANVLFVDPIVEKTIINDLPWKDFTFTVTVGYKPGVTDNVGHTASVAIKDVDKAFKKEWEDFIHAYKVYVFWEKNNRLIPSVTDYLFNPIVEFSNVDEKGVKLPDYNLSKSLDATELFKEIPIRNASDADLVEISRTGLLALNTEEMKKIQGYYKKKGREPTDIELETFAQTWSEHCVHKTLKGDVIFTRITPDGSKSVETINNLIKTTIFGATQDIIAKQGKDNICISIFKDNAGIISFNDKYSMCFKAETHNHPSAKEPYGGAATGIGGVIRDVLAAGLGAKPIANTDIFCFAEPDFPENRIPEGVIHPRKIMEGVVSGVRDYGNPMGIPTVNGALYFDKRYLGNPLVFCGTVGIIPRFIQGSPSEVKKPKVGDYLVFVGGKTGRDGIHGVTFASLEMDKHTTSNPVQIGDPITEQMFMEAMFKARDNNLYNFVQDCGGGGLSSALGEMAEELGAVIFLDKVPLKYQGLRPWEIWISESQERQAFSVPQDKFEAFKRIFEQEDVGVYNVGQITGDKKLTLKYKDVIVGELDVDFLHKEVPRITNNATWQEYALFSKPFPAPPALKAILLGILKSWNVCSKEWIIRQYDSEVQGNTVIKPLQGRKNDGPGDGAVMRPDPSSFEGIAIANGMNPKYGDLDPYNMAASGIDEAIRNAVCCGANPNHVALLDNFCWGNPKDPVQMARLVLACNACKDISIAFGAPFISGKNSLNNEYKTDEGTISIPATLLISSIGKVEDVRHACTSYFKTPGSGIFIVGKTRNELGGSHYLEIIKQSDKSNIVPIVEPGVFLNQYKSLHEAMRKGTVISAHDCSEGGMAVALAEMCFSGDFGADVEVKLVPTNDDCQRDDIILFSESNGRILVEVLADKEDEFMKIMKGCIVKKIGMVTNEPCLKITGLDGTSVLSAKCNELKQSWQTPLDIEKNLGRA